MIKHLLKNRILIAFLSGLIIFSVFVLAAYSNYSYQIETHKQVASSEIEIAGKGIEQLINNQIYRSQGLATYFMQNPNVTIEQLDDYSKLLYNDTQTILRSVALLNDTTIFYTHPLIGNEAVLGVDLSAIPAQRNDVLRVKNELITIVSGPVDLVQGGRGIVIRIPIVQPNSQSTTFYKGQMSVVLDYQMLLTASKLDNLMKTYNLSLIEKYKNMESKTIYSNIDKEIVDASEYTLSLPNIEWAILYSPKSGWSGTSPYFYSILALGFFSSILIAYALYRQFLHTNTLHLLVSERTSALLQTNEYLEETLAEVEEKQSELFILNDELEKSLEHLTETQAQLIQSEKFAALGELVAGVAHEINTPLGIGITLATFVEDKHHRITKLFDAGQLSKSVLHEYNESVGEALSVMVNSLNRSAEIIGSFKNVAGEQSALELRDFNVRDYLEDMLQNLKPRLKKTPYEITLICEPNLIIYNYPGLFSHILTNFIVNSLIHGFVDLDSGHITINFYKRDDHYVLTYSDNGHGISADHIEHIFDPFYTTKKGQGSTGLGLHIVHNIVTQNLNGKISLITGENKGVTFTIEFPLIESPFRTAIDPDADGKKQER